MVSTQFKTVVKLDHFPIVGIGIKTVWNHQLVYVCKYIHMHTYTCIYNIIIYYIHMSTTHWSNDQPSSGETKLMAPRPFLPFPWRQVPDDLRVSIDSSFYLTSTRGVQNSWPPQPWLLCPWWPPLQWPGRKTHIGRPCQQNQTSANAWLVGFVGVCWVGWLLLLILFILLVLLLWHIDLDLENHFKFLSTRKRLAKENESKQKEWSAIPRRDTVDQP